MQKMLNVIALMNINHWAKRTVNDYLNRSINHYENLINSENSLGGLKVKIRVINNKTIN